MSHIVLFISKHCGEIDFESFSNAFVIRSCSISDDLHLSCFDALAGNGLVLVFTNAMSKQCQVKKKTSGFKSMKQQSFIELTCKMFTSVYVMVNCFRTHTERERVKDTLLLKHTAVS